MIKVDKENLSVKFKGIQPSDEVMAAIDDLVNAAFEEPCLTKTNPTRRKQTLKSLDLAMTAILFNSLSK